MEQLGRPAKSPMRVSAPEFNGVAECYYRRELRNVYLREGLNFLTADLLGLANTEGATRKPDSPSEWRASAAGVA
ncbi:MAG: hypothetical protein U5J62_05565 [Desulfurivibrio sp.]|nr:hypothetical protein [Desulfurivibrio sp.]